jgi:hypothetical protein
MAAFMEISKLYVLSSVMECRWAVYLKLRFGITEQEDGSVDADEDEEDED